MAGEWIKFELATLDKPEVIRIARSLGLSQEAVCGWLIRFWGWVRSNSVDGVVDGVEYKDVDMVLSLPGFGEALDAVGWLKFDAATRRLTVPHFDRHNSESSKKRALKSERQARYRAKTVDAVVDAPIASREEKRRVIPPISPNGGFERFWQVYPKKRSRGQAEKAFSKLNPDEQLLTVLLGAVERAKTQEAWRRDNGQFVPHPATWLNAKGWLDETPERPALRVAL